MLPRHLQVIDLLFKQKDYQSAALALEEARKRFPQAGLLTYYHGVALSQIKHHEEAMRAFEKALVEAGNSQPDLLNADFYFDYGAAAEQAGQYVKATELFRKSIELDPPTPRGLTTILATCGSSAARTWKRLASLFVAPWRWSRNNGAYIDSLGWLYFKAKQIRGGAHRAASRGGAASRTPILSSLSTLETPAISWGERQRPFCIGRRHSNSILTIRSLVPGSTKPPKTLPNSPRPRLIHKLQPSDRRDQPLIHCFAPGSG